MPGVKPMPRQVRRYFADLGILSRPGPAPAWFSRRCGRARGGRSGGSALGFSGCADWRLRAEESDAGLVEP